MFVAALLVVSACSTTPPVEESFVSLTIDYGAEKPPRTVQVPFTAGQTALEILQHAATVETYPVADYVFVTSIDGVKGERGKMGWYYKVDGNPIGKLAVSNEINRPCRIEWIYTKDRCSATVDRK